MPAREVRKGERRKKEERETDEGREGNSGKDIQVMKLIQVLTNMYTSAITLLCMCADICIG